MDKLPMQTHSSLGLGFQLFLIEAVHSSVFCPVQRCLGCQWGCEREGRCLISQLLDYSWTLPHLNPFCLYFQLPQVLTPKTPAKQYSCRSWVFLLGVDLGLTFAPSLSGIRGLSGSCGVGGWWHAGHQEEGDKELVLWSQVQVACAVGKRALPLAAVWGEELTWLLLPKQGQ